ncbi:cytochrome P450 4C1-like, partial [Chrysoperla carnea]|uniref:cytochrome P450 4C1-like n=1 Tax=Chrysoperla carnea TaxID=189513 RepID=UPI001D06866F
MLEQCIATIEILACTGVLLLVGKAILKIYAWSKMFMILRQVPGPKGHWLYGNAAQYLSKEKFFYYSAKWREQFKDFHKTSILFHPLIIMQSPEAVQAIISKMKHNKKGFIYEGLKPLLGEGLITSLGSKWHTHRRLVTPTFHFNILESFLKVFIERTNGMMDQLRTLSETENFVDISPFTQRLTLDFICETAMGTPIKSEGSKQAEIVSAMHKLEEIGIYRMIRPWLLFDFIFRFTMKYREQNKYKNILHTFTDEVIQERRNALKSKKNNDEQNADYEDEVHKGKRKAIFMDLLILSSENGELLTNQDIREEVNTFMFAGQNTTQLAINFCLYLLGENPSIQDQVHEELSAIFDGSDRDPTMDDLKNMKYLERCIKEALRLFPSVPVIARQLTDEENIDGYRLPIGADILIVPYVLHRDPVQFPNPEAFDPDNFLPERVSKRHPYSYIPFSAGPRNCIGQKFAQLAVKTVVSTILRQYYIESRDKREDLIVVPNTVLVPKKGIKIKLHTKNN